RVGPPEEPLNGEGPEQGFELVQDRGDIPFLAFAVPLCEVRARGRRRMFDDAEAYGGQEEELREISKAEDDPRVDSRLDACTKGDPHEFLDLHPPRPGRGLLTGIKSLEGTHEEIHLSAGIDAQHRSQRIEGWE